MKFKFLVLLIMVILFNVACDRDQGGTGTVFNKESAKDFTTLPPDQQQKVPKPPPLPGRAEISGAPFEDYPTKTGSAYIPPSTITQPPNGATP